ncbi:MAG: hypothetical protein JXO22_08665, partial [Phycisphaerae bacterium]|nr:hypothetical protein [Phycisphaerae bacterium]
MRSPRRIAISGGDWIAVAVLLVMPGILFWQGIAAPPDFVRQDAASFFQPYYTFASDEVMAGRLP